MSFEAVTFINNAEKEAKNLIDEANAKAKQILAEADAAGKAAVDAALAKADSELSVLRSRSDEKAAEDSEHIGENVENKKAAIRARAESRLDKAAAIIAERIVNS